MGHPRALVARERGRVACGARMKPSNNGTFSTHDAGFLVLVHGVFGVGGSGHGDDLELVAGEHHELVAEHIGGLGVLSRSHGDGLELVAGHTGDSWCHRAVVGAIGR